MLFLPHLFDSEDYKVYLLSQMKLTSFQVNQLCALTILVKSLKSLPSDSNEFTWSAVTP